MDIINSGNWWHLIVVGFFFGFGFAGGSALFNALLALVRRKSA
jgi:high-affinity nickel permease